MPKFTIRIRATNNINVPVKVHIGASLIGQKDAVEYYNTSDDITGVLKYGKNEYTRYLNTELGRNQKYDLVIALWEGEETIGQGIKLQRCAYKSACRCFARRKRLGGIL